MSITQIPCREGYLMEKNAHCEQLQEVRFHSNKYWYFHLADHHNYLSRKWGYWSPDMGVSHKSFRPPSYRRPSYCLFFVTQLSLKKYCICCWSLSSYSSVTKVSRLQAIVGRDILFLFVIVIAIDKYCNCVLCTCVLATCQDIVSGFVIVSLWLFFLYDIGLGATGNGQGHELSSFFNKLMNFTERNSSLQLCNNSDIMIIV